MKKPELTKEEVQKRHDKGWGDILRHKEDYHGFYTIHDFGHLGKKHLMRLHKIGRNGDFASDLEAQVAAIFDYMQEIDDLRENVVMDRDETDAIYRELGFPVPRGPIPNTLDLLLTFKEGYPSKYHAIAAKYPQDLEDIRVIRNLEVSRIYHNRRGITWSLMTPLDLPQIFVFNIFEIVRLYHSLEGRNISDEELELAKGPFTKEVLKEDKSLNEVVAKLELELPFPKLKLLPIAYFLIANHYWSIDMNQPINPHNVLQLTAYAESLVREPSK